MIHLLLRVVFTVGFNHVLRYSQARTRRPLLAAGVNYILATAACAAWAMAEASPPSGAALGLGILAGVNYVITLLVMLPAMRQSGVSVAGAVNQLALMAPIAFAVLRFDERPSWQQAGGIALTLIALPLLSFSSAVRDGTRKRRFGWMTLLVFISSGAAQIIMKELTSSRPRAELAFYSTILFATATVLTFAWLAAGRAIEGAASPGGAMVSEWPVGLALGAANVLQLVFLLFALRSLPAVVVFPVSACLGILVNAAASLVLWRERPAVSGWIGLVLAAAAVLLSSST